MHTLIITVPAYPERDLDAFQRRVLEGLALGVLIVPEESSLRAALLGEKLPMAAWRAIGRVLDVFGEEASPIARPRMARKEGNHVSQNYAV